ncbi:MAG TPA: hypothetical protein VMS17_25775 [Gemmataceae bacterium]|nr:hypothetical protein [Gemmataceae bacterium]
MSSLHPALPSVYANRGIALPGLAILIQSVHKEPLPANRLLQAHADLFPADFAERARRIELLRQNRDILALVDRQHKAGEIETFRYGSGTYDAADARRMMEGIDRQMLQEESWWSEFDQRVFRIHYQMARELSDQTGRDLRIRCEFQTAMQDIERDTAARRRRLAKVASFVDEAEAMLPYEDFHAIRQELLEAWDVLTKSLHKASRLTAPELHCAPSGKPLARVLLAEAPVHRLRPVAQTVSPGWVSRLGRQMDEVRRNTRRILDEALQDLLTELEWIASHWIEQLTAPPEAEEAEELDVSPEERAAQESLLQPLDDEPEFELSEEDVVTEPLEQAERLEAELDEAPDEEEFALSEQDVLAEPTQADADLEFEDIDPDDHRDRPRHWNV